MLKHSLEVNPFSADSNETGNASEKKSHRRTKRFLSYPRFVEVMVVADSRMVAYHGANLQHYVLTLMSIVSTQLGREIHPQWPKSLLWAEFLCDTTSLSQLGMEIMPRLELSLAGKHCLELPTFSNPFHPISFLPSEPIFWTRSTTGPMIHRLNTSAYLGPWEIAAELKMCCGDHAFSGMDASRLRACLNSLAV